MFALSLDGGTTLPAVHGWMGVGEAMECSLAEYSGNALEAVRDFAGTRPLYASRFGRWVATDWRYFPGEECDLLPPGARINVETGRTKTDSLQGRPSKGSVVEAAKELASLIDSAVEARLNGVKKAAVSFSGGLDSSILAACAMKHTETIGCTVHASRSRDSQAAPSAAKSLGLELLQVDVSERAARESAAAASLPFKPDLMDRSLWCVYSLASQMAAGAGAGVIMLGQLADELFGGYSKYQLALEERGPGHADELMREDIAGCASRGFIRDEAACSKWLEPRFPFADPRVIRAGFSMPVSFKVDGTRRKAVLREAASMLGVPKELVNAPKKAAQYSSGIQKLLG